MGYLAGEATLDTAMTPETKYARSGNLHIAYQVVAIRDAVRALGLAVRVGVHTGECEVIGAKIGGLAVHIGARVTAAAGVDDVLVSSTVKDLVAGSGLRFEDRGAHVLKGVPGEWRLFAVAAGRAA